jgi:hypothetical protein
VGNAQQQTNSREHDDDARSSVAHERERQPFVRQRTGDDSYVDEGLQANEERKPAPQQKAERVGRSRGNYDPAYKDHHKGQHHEKGCDQAELFANDRENEISMVLRHESEFLAAVAKA